MQTAQDSNILGLLRRRLSRYAKKPSKVNWKKHSTYPVKYPNTTGASPKDSIGLVQVVSGRFYVDPPGFIDRLNSNIPNQIRIFGFNRVTSSFSAKKFCDRRRYVYLIPVFALDRNAHRDRESVLASLGSDNELVKCLECSERGRKVLGAMGKHYSGPKIEDNKAEIESGVVSESLVVEVREENLEMASVECGNGDEKGVLENGSGFSYGEKEERFNRILSHYVGTHNFHNFTTRIKAEDPSAVRFIISFNANSVVTVDGMDFVKCEVVGQSFMLHQIKKLVGLAVAIMRDCAPESLIETALQKDVRINVPTAPEVGLYLEECFFTSYNQKWKDTHEEISMEAYVEQAEDFKMKQVYSHIASMEQKEGSVAVWLHSLNLRNYPDLRFVEDNETCTIGENVQVESIGGKV